MFLEYWIFDLPGYHVYPRTYSPDSGVNYAFSFFLYLVNVGRKEALGLCWWHFPRTVAPSPASIASRLFIPSRPLSTSFPCVILFPLCHPLLVYLRSVILLCTVTLLFRHLCVVQSCLRALLSSRPLRPSPESVLVAAARVPIRAILVLWSLMMPLMCQLNILTN